MGKKDKKHKKKKKQKRQKRSRSSSTSSSSDDEQSPTKVSKTSDAPEKHEVLKRDEWMDLAGSLTSTCFSSLKARQKEKQSTATAIFDKPGQSSRELNPYWKDGGTGIPQQHAEQSQCKPTMDADWLKKSLRRAQEQAVQEGRTLEEIAAERWGSLDVIKSMIAKAENQNIDSHRYDQRNRKYIKSALYNHKSYEKTGHERSKSFRKPYNDYDVYTNISNKSSSTDLKKWQKPEKRQEHVGICIEQPNMSKQSTNASMEINWSSHLTEAEMNKLGAKIIKAEIMGNHELAAQLKQQLEEARKNVSLQKDKNEETVILTRTDQQGVERPLLQREQSVHSQGRSGKKKLTDTHVSGERVRYFMDDDKYNLRKMFEHEKGRSTSEDDAMLAKLASKSGDLDELFEQKISEKGFSNKQESHNRMLAIKEHQQMSKSLDSCGWCINSKHMLKHMIIAMDSKMCLSLPPYSSLLSGHCILTPLNHVSCQVQLDEDVWNRLQDYKKALIRMFKDQQKYVIFFEVFKGQHKFPHMQLQCIPLPEEIATEAPIYFKKAILECETEWSSNKKVVDLYKKNLRQAIPRGLAYFAVNFGDEGGYGHVIEDDHLFPRNFAEEIIGGMLDLDHSLWRKPKRESFDEQKRKVMEFVKIWKRYDPGSSGE